MGKRSAMRSTWTTRHRGIGSDAVRYSLARYPADSPLWLDGEEMRRQTNDNPVFYVQYAHARTVGVARLAAEDRVHRADGFDPALLTDRPKPRCSPPSGPPRVVAQAAHLLEPHRVARYLEDLAARYHKWYDTCRVRPLADEKSPDCTGRDCGSTTPRAKCSQNGLDLLGVTRPSACERGGSR